MALIGSGNVPEYPNPPGDQVENRSDGDVPDFKWFNDIQEAAIIPQTVLGFNPEGSFASVVLRLDDVDTRINANALAYASGNDTISGGSTSQVVTHGSSVTPTEANISISFRNNPTNDPGNWWITNVTATQFTLNVRTDPGNFLNFSWQVIVPQP